MTYDKRLDGRKKDEMRPITAKVGVIKNADGSAMFTIGKTIAYAAVYGPKELFPKFMQNPQKGILRVNYNMMTFSGMGERVRPGQNRRAKELSMVMRNALEPVLDLKNFPNSVVDVFVEYTQTDAGSRCAGICAASMALADAGLPMKDLVTSVAVGRVDKTMVVDLDYKEEHYPEFATQQVEDEDVADIAVAMLPNSGQITLLQMDGIANPKDLTEGIALARDAMKKIYEVQKNALKDKFQGGSQ